MRRGINRRVAGVTGNVLEHPGQVRLSVTGIRLPVATSARLVFWSGRLGSRFAGLRPGLCRGPLDRWGRRKRRDGLDGLGRLRRGRMGDVLGSGRAGRTHVNSHRK